MEYVIWGAGASGIWSKNILEQLVAKKCVVAFADNNLSKLGTDIEGIPVISVWKLKVNYKKCAVLIPGIYGERAVRTIVKEIESVFGENQIFVVPYNTFKKQEVIIEDILCPLNNWAQIDNLGIKLANHCNLNCIRCATFSNIADEEYYQPEDVEKDLKQLSMLIPNVINVKLIGGEPLLNNYLPEIIGYVKKYYPYANILIVTNGVLLLGLNEKQIQCMRENSVKVYMTLYPVMQKKVDEIASVLKRNEIEFNIYRSGDFFIPMFNEVGKYELGYVKLQDDKIKCVSLYKGEICKCMPGLSISIYNKRYDKDFPIDGIHSIYQEGLTGEKLMQILDEAFELCRFCNGCFNLNEKQYGKRWSLGEAKWDDWMEFW